MFNLTSSLFNLFLGLTKLSLFIVFQFFFNFITQPHKYKSIIVDFNQKQLLLYFKKKYFILLLASLKRLFYYFTFFYDYYSLL